MKRTKEDYSSFNLFSIVGTWESVNLNPTVIIYRSDKEYPKIRNYHPIHD